MPLTTPENLDDDETPEPPEPSGPRTEVTDEEVAVNADGVAGQTLREALEAQVAGDERVHVDIFEQISRLDQENDDLAEEMREIRVAVGELTEAVELLAEQQGALAGKDRPTIRLDEGRVVRE